MPIPCLRLGLALVLGCTAFLSDARAEEDAPSPGDLLRRAEAFYWLGITDQSNTRAFGRGLALVKEAKRLLEPADPALPPQRKAQRKLERQRAEALQEDLTAQLDVSTGRFYDVYPLVRVIGPALVGTVGAPGRYDTDGPPDVVAATTAAGKLADKVLQVWRGHPQLHVVLRTAPSDDGRILNEVLYHLGSNPRLVIHPPAKIAPLGSTDDPVTLLNALNVQHLLVVTIQRKAVLPSRDLFFYGVEGQLYRKAATRSRGASEPRPSHCGGETPGFTRSTRSSRCSCSPWRRACCCGARSAVDGSAPRDSSSWPARSFSRAPSSSSSRRS